MLAKAMVLQADAAGVKLVLVTLDAVALWQEEADRIRGAMIERLRLSPEHVMIHTSHTHSSPIIPRQHADRPGGHLSDRTLTLCRNVAPGSQRLPGHPYRREY
jgi:hypothetical protein